MIVLKCTKLFLRSTILCRPIMINFSFLGIKEFFKYIKSMFDVDCFRIDSVKMIYLENVYLNNRKNLRAKNRQSCIKFSSSKNGHGPLVPLSMVLFYFKLNSSNITQRPKKTYN